LWFGEEEIREQYFANEQLLRPVASETQEHKHPHHDGAVFPSSGMVFMDEHTAPLGVSSQGVGQGSRQRVLAESIK